VASLAEGAASLGIPLISTTPPYPAASLFHPIAGNRTVTRMTTCQRPNSASSSGITAIPNGTEPIPGSATRHPHPAPPSETPQSQQKKLPIPWDTDGEQEGQSSIGIVLEWLSVEGNYQRWRGHNTLGGTTKTALADEILAQMTDAGITHRDSKGIQTKIHELQTAYEKARDFLTRSGPALIKNGNSDQLRAVLLKKCRYWDDLHSIMGISNPPVIMESTNLTVPNLLGRPHKDPPLNERAAASEEVDKQVSEKDNGAMSRGALKRKASSEESSDLEVILTRCYAHRLQCLEARERRDRMRLEAETERARIEALREERQLAHETRMIKIEEKVLQMKMRRLEMEEVCARIDFKKQLKDMGHSADEIERFLREHFPRGEWPKSRWTTPETSTSTSSV